MVTEREAQSVCMSAVKVASRFARGVAVMQDHNGRRVWVQAALSIVESFSLQPISLQSSLRTSAKPSPNLRKVW